MMQTAKGVTIQGPVSAEHAEILTVEAQQFVATLHRCFNGRRTQLLQSRNDKQKQIDAGVMPDFLHETR